MTRAIIFLTLLASSMIACAPEITDVVDAEEGRDDDLGPLGVERMDLTLWDGPFGIDTEVHLPLDGGARMGPRPAVVFVQGGLVPVSRYRWLAERIASRGVVVLSPAHFFDLAFFAQNNAKAVLEDARRQSALEGSLLFDRIDVNAPAVIMGHSLGGVVAAKAWLNEPELFSRLILLASEPDTADDFSEREDPATVLSIVGSNDARETVDEAVAGAKSFPDAVVAVVEGMNHYQLTSDYTESELETDGVATLDDAAAWAKTMEMVEAVLNLEYGAAAGPAPLLDDPATWPEGVTAAPLD